MDAVAVVHGVTIVRFQAQALIHQPAMSAFGQTGNQFTSMPWALITLPHLSTSSAMCFANPSAVNGIGSTPNWDNRSFTMGLASASFVASLSVLMISGGVLAGAPSPYQPNAS